MTLQVEDDSLCKGVSLPGTLLLAVSLDLQLLDSIGPDLRVLDSLSHRVQLVFEMSAGSYLVWPGLPEGFQLDSPLEGGAKQELGSQDAVCTKPVDQTDYT